MNDMPTFLAAVFRNGEAHAVMETMSLTDLRDDEVLIRVVAAGICHTDLTCRNGFMPMPRPIILGHEGSGIVERAGAAVTAVAPGDHVVMTFMSCGGCPRCRTGEPAYCAHFFPGNMSGRRLDGTTALQCEGEDIAAHFFGQSSFATYSVANVRNVVKVRNDAPLELLGPLGCGVQTGAGSVMNVLQPKPGESLVVFGAGGVGLSAVMAAAVEGCKPIIVVEPNPARRALALELGAHEAIDPINHPDLVAALRELTGGGVYHALDTCGIPAVVTQAIGALAQHGQLVLLTGTSLEASITLPLIGLVSIGARIYGVNEGSSVPQEFIPKLVDLIMAGRFPLEKLVKYYDFEQINEALEAQEHGKVIKPILRMK
jgi:aryl-alcohol dehydrogenase